jgi:two-component system, NarL family, invasion response regulator UvrY
MKKILIADDHSIVRIGTTMLIKDALHNQVAIQEATTFDQALALLHNEEVNLILLDINIPGGNNIDMINAIKVRNKNVKILVFSSYDESIFAIRYIKAGANGYLSKDSSEEEFKKAILSVLDGNIYLSDKLKEQSISDFLGKKSNINTLQDMSNREIEVINLLVKGYSTSEIAHTLNIRLNTVSTFKSHIYTKLNVSNVVELISKVQLYS